AKPQVNVRKQNLLSPERAGLRVGMSRCFVSAFQALRRLLPPVTWAFTRHARSSPGCNIAGFQPDWAAGKPPLRAAGIFVSLRETVGKCPNSRDRLPACLLSVLLPDDAELLTRSNRQFTRFGSPVGRAAGRLRDQAPTSRFPHRRDR